MSFIGFPEEGMELLQLNRLQNSKSFYDEHKEEIRQNVIEPFYALIEEMTPIMLQIDPLFVTNSSRMVSRIRRDTRFTKDKTMYRANLWLFFRRPRNDITFIPAYYFEIHPNYWRFGCWGACGRGEMAVIRQMIQREDKRFIQAYEAVRSCPGGVIAGEPYKRLKFPHMNSDYQNWMNRKELGVDFREEKDFTPLWNGSFVSPMIQNMQRLAPFYSLLLAAQQQAVVRQKDNRSSK